MSKLIADEALREAKRDIVIELSNAYFETYRYDRPNDSVEQLSAFCRDIAENDVDDLLAAAQRQLLTELLEQLPAKKLYNIEHENQFELSEFDGFNNCLDQVVSIIEHYLTKAEPEQGEKG